MKNSVFWDVTLWGSFKNGRFSEMSVLTRATRRNIPEDCMFPLEFKVVPETKCISPLSQFTFSSEEEVCWLTPNQHRHTFQKHRQSKRLPMILN
jgi:hypothetical protein